MQLGYCVAHEWILFDMPFYTILNICHFINMAVKNIEESV